MRVGIYSLHDSKVGFMQPTFAYSDEVAVRDFGHAVQTTRGIMQSYSADFTLYRVGYFDTENGTVIPCDPESLVNGMHFHALNRGDVDA